MSAVRSAAKRVESFFSDSSSLTHYRCSLSRERAIFKANLKEERAKGKLLLLQEQSALDCGIGAFSVASRQQRGADFNRPSLRVTAA